MTTLDWWNSVKSIAKDAKLEYLLSGSFLDHFDSWQHGLTPRQEMQELYEDADCPYNNELNGGRPLE